MTSTTKKFGLAIIAAGAVAATLATVVAPLTSVGRHRFIRLSLDHAPSRFLLQ